MKPDLLANTTPENRALDHCDLPSLDGNEIAPASLLHATERLISVIRELSLARSLDGIMKIVRHAARDLTGADGASFVLRDGAECYYADEEALAPLWKGRRFPMDICVSGWAMMHKSPVVIEDILSDERIPVDIYLPTFVRSLVMVPIRTSEPFGAVGVYWAGPCRPNSSVVEFLQALADATSVAMENLQVYQDLSQANTALKVSEDHFRRSFDEGPVGAAFVGLDFRFQRVNEALCRMTGYSKEELMALTFPDITHPDDLEADLEKVSSLLSGEIDQYEMDKRYVKKDGLTMWIKLHVRLMRDAGGNPLYFLPMMEDITERKTAEQEIEAYAARLERLNQELEEFTYRASHDLQEPLRKIQVFSSAVERMGAEAGRKEGVEYLHRLKKSAAQMQYLINGLKEYSEITVKPEPHSILDLKEIVEDVVEELNELIEQSQARIEVGEMHKIEAGRVQMKQLIRHIIHNALKYRSEKAPLIAIHDEASGQRCRIFFRDNGIGFDKIYFDRILKPFQRLHSRSEYEGAGLGLAICRRIVEHHDGRIEAESEPGKGSTFIVELPLSRCKGKDGK